ncbi:hypothetical protein [Rhabdothermincola sediminis]|uniref:hypothetical protein n=1 Tax=Rhabdothermincola sediminis TaxID=2751370 RepID=UPI001AA033C1|nr:hypothetical protein [Rhabdothermincola sediminis]
MATIDTWRSIGDDPELRVGPSDREVIEVLQRLASAKAHLVHAEREVQAAQCSRGGEEQVRVIEQAHAEVLWAQAGLLATPKAKQARQAFEVARAREEALLRRHGYGSFAEFRARRRAVPTAELHLELARREHAAALEAWEQLQSAMAPTLIIDLTGDEPRVLR